MSKVLPPRFYTKIKEELIGKATFKCSFCSVHRLLPMNKHGGPTTRQLQGHLRDVHPQEYEHYFSAGPSRASGAPCSSDAATSSKRRREDEDDTEVDPDFLSGEPEYAVGCMPTGGSWRVGYVDHAGCRPVCPAAQPVCSSLPDYDFLMQCVPGKENVTVIMGCRRCGLVRDSLAPLA